MAGFSLRVVVLAGVLSRCKSCNLSTTARRLDHWWDKHLPVGDVRHGLTPGAFRPGSALDSADDHSNTIFGPGNELRFLWLPATATGFRSIGTARPGLIRA